MLFSHLEKMLLNIRLTSGLGGEEMRKTQQAFLYVSMMLLFICFYAYAQGTNDLMQLDQMMAAMKTEQLELEEWAVYLKQPLRDKNAVISQLHDFTWEELNASTMQGTYEYPKIQMKEIVTIMKKRHSPDYLLSYEARGTSFLLDDWSQAKANIENKQQMLFINRVHPFALVRGKTNAKDQRNANELSQSLLENLNGKEVESLTERDFLAVSAFRKDWQNTLITGDNEMNLQLAIRASDNFIGVKTVTIGTPIITTEY